MARLEFFFDCSSPWTYLAFVRIQDVIARTGAEAVWKPILVGGVFNAVNPDVYARRANPDPRKSVYYAKDLADWARFTGIRIGMPKVFPVRAVDLMRGALVAADEGRLVPYATAAFEAYWGDLRDVSQRAEIAAIAGAAGLDGRALIERIDAPDIKARLRTNTEELIERGGFGSPTMFVDGDDMYFGNDRLALVEAALSRGA